MLLLRICLLGISNITEISCQSVVHLVVNNRHVFHWPAESRQLSARLLGISYPRSCLCATERRAALGLKLRIVWRCYMCAVAAELCGCSCCMLLQSCAVCCSFLLSQDEPQDENKMRRSLLPNNLRSTLRCASAKREVGCFHYYFDIMNVRKRNFNTAQQHRKNNENEPEHFGGKTNPRPLSCNNVLPD